MLALPHQRPIPLWPSSSPHASACSLPPLPAPAPRCPSCSPSDASARSHPLSSSTSWGGGVSPRDCVNDRGRGGGDGKLTQPHHAPAPQQHRLAVVAASTARFSALLAPSALSVPAAADAGELDPGSCTSNGLRRPQLPYVRRRRRAAAGHDRTLRSHREEPQRLRCHQRVKNTSGTAIPM
jgi:hypothetical protein